MPGGWATVAAAALVTTAPLLVLVRGFRGDAYPSAATRLWLVRPFWYVQAALPLLAGAGALGALLGWPFGVAGVAGRGSVALALTLLGAAAAAGYAGSRRLRVARLEARFPDLPAALDGTRIVQLSDLHVGPHTSRRHLARVAAAVRAARPDLIVHTGDQVDDFARDVHVFADAFRDLDAPLGVFAVAGNHDVYAGWRAVREGMETMGITVLVNEAVALSRGDARLWLAGTGDPAGASARMAAGGGEAAAPDIPRTLAGIPADGFSVVLAHNPVLWPALARGGARLTLSGHTHHGQLAIPRLGWSLATPFLDHAMGTHRDGASLLYIHPGTNYWGLPFRIGALPEVAVLTLRRAPGEEPAIRPASRTAPAPPA